MARSEFERVTRERVVVRQSYFWPDWQLNLWLIVMLGAGGTLVGISASFINQQQKLGGLGIPWIMPYGITVGTLTIVFIAILLGLIVQRRLLPGIVIIGSFILAVLFLAGFIETAIQLFGPVADINSKCTTYILGQPSEGLTIQTLALLEQTTICQSWQAVFSFWVIGTVFLVYMIVLASMVAQGNIGED